MNSFVASPIAVAVYGCALATSRFAVLTRGGVPESFANAAMIFRMVNSLG